MRSSQNSKNTPRAALLLYGVVHRSLRHTIASLRNHVIESLEKHAQVDVFYHSWDLKEIHNPRTGEFGLAVDPAEVGQLLPEARGLMEAQCEYDESVDWDPWFRQNPMRHCSPTDEAARVCLMNFRRGLESQERVWRYFQRKKECDYDFVVVSRADLMFLQELCLPQELLSYVIRDRSAGIEAEIFPSIWVPIFHAWGGVNDRFALGKEKEVGVYLNRGVFAEKWLANANQGNAEWLLMKWLEHNRLEIKYLDFVFKRIRADGCPALFDRDLTPLE